MAGPRGHGPGAMVTSGQRFTWDETPWVWGRFWRQTAPEFNVVAIDYGIKRTSCACLPASLQGDRGAGDDLGRGHLAMKPDGIFLSNGPGDPAATGKYAVPVIRQVISSGTPTFGICLGHQMLGWRRRQDHEDASGPSGANHPVKDETTGKVEITSMNHGLRSTRRRCRRARPRPISRCSTAQLRHRARRQTVFLVQYHPEPRPARATRTICSSASPI